MKTARTHAIIAQYLSPYQIAEHVPNVIRSLFTFTIEGLRRVPPTCVIQARLAQLR